LWESIAISTKKKDKPRSSDEAFQAWQAFASQAQNKDFMDNIIMSNKNGSENFQKLFKTGWDNYSFFQKKINESSMGMDKIFETFKQKNPESDFFNAGMEFYRKEFSKFFSIPKLGLSRTYQEKMNDVLDKFNVFNGTVAEFMYFLYIPFEESFKVVQKKLAELAEKDALPEDVNEYYRMWLAQLESHYMELYKTREYTTVLGKVLSAMGEFTKAKQSMTQDSLKMFGIPAEEDLDELYKDIYLMKKRIKDLEKKSK
jgi:hypothetical protein